MIKNVTKLVVRGVRNVGEGGVRNAKNEVAECGYVSRGNANLLGDIKIQYSFARKLFNSTKTV